MNTTQEARSLLASDLEENRGGGAILSPHLEADVREALLLVDMDARTRARLCFARWLYQRGVLTEAD